MSVISDIRTVLINRIGALSTVKKVYGFEHPSPSGWPAVFVVADLLEAEFTSNVENRRTFTFNIFVLYPTSNNKPADATQEELSNAEDAIYEVFDQISEDLDQNAFNNAFVDIGDSDSEYLFAGATDAEWGFQQYEGGVARALKIPLRVVVDFRARTS